MASDPQEATRPSSRVSISPRTWMRISVGPMANPPAWAGSAIRFADVYCDIEGIEGAFAAFPGCGFAAAGAGADAAGGAGVSGGGGTVGSGAFATTGPFGVCAAAG